MSFQSSSHFDSTMLLIVKPEIDNTIKNVENGVSNLLEDGSLPFGIDDALLNLEQCSHVLQLIDQPSAGKLTILIAKIMQKIIADSTRQDINIANVEAMSEATNVIKRYLDFLCVREIRAPQFLISTINKLEIALGEPLTREGVFVSPFLETMQLHVNIDAPTPVADTQYLSRLYKITLLKFLKQQETELDFRALALCGQYLAALSANTPSAQYWRYVESGLSQLNQMILTEPRLRVLINIERQIEDFLAQPDTFSCTHEDISDAIAFCLTQNSTLSQQIREQLNVVDDVLSDDQLEILSRQLYGPELQTIQTIVALLSESIREVNDKIETGKYQQDEEERTTIYTRLNEISNILDVINLSDAAQQLRVQSTAIIANEDLNNSNHVTQVVNSLLFTTNSLQILERNYTPNRLKLSLNNTHITLEKLEEAQRILTSEARISLQNVTEHIVTYTQNNNISEFETLADTLKEVSGAFLFLDSPQLHANLQQIAHIFEQHIVPTQYELDEEKVKLLATVIASADFYLEQLQNHQPFINNSTTVGTHYLEKFTQAVA